MARKRELGYDDEYMNDLRAILQQAQREKWNTIETSIVVNQLRFVYDMKYNEPKFKGVVSDG